MMKRILLCLSLVTLFSFSAEAATLSGRLCANKKTGSIVAVSRRCPSGYSQISKNNLKSYVATKGAKGSQGPRGEKGLTGDTGPQGEKGIRGESGFDTIPRGKTLYGAIGGIMTGPTSISGDVAAWSQSVSIPGVVPGTLSDTDVIVVYNSLFSNCTLNAPNRFRFNCLDESDRVVSSQCTGSAQAPTAPVGKVCIYAIGLNNVYSVKGSGVVGGRNGFEVQWVSAPSESPITEFKGVWAYTAQ